MALTTVPADGLPIPNKMGKQLEFSFPPISHSLKTMVERSVFATQTQTTNDAKTRARVSRACETANEKPIKSSHKKQPKTKSLKS